MRDSSSLSAMIPSISALRASSMSGSCPASGSRCGAGTRRVVVDLLAEQADNAARGAVVAGDGQVQRQHAVAEHACALGHQRGELRAVVVQLGDHDGAWHVDRRALVPQHSSGPVDALDGGQDEQCRVRAAQPGAQVTTKSAYPGASRMLTLMSSQWSGTTETLMRAFCCRISASS